MSSDSSSTQRFPKVKGDKWWDNGSAVFSFFGLIFSLISILKSNFGNYFPEWLDFLSRFQFALLFSICAYFCLIVHIDVPGKFGQKLIELGKSNDIPQNTLIATRPFVVLTYFFGNLLGVLVIELFNVFSWTLGYIVIGVFIGLILCLNRFRDVVRGTPDLQLIAAVNGAYLMGFVFSVILGFGGDFYLSAWTFIVNIIAKFNKKGKSIKKKDEQEYWDKVLHIDVQNPVLKIVSGLILFDLFLFFVLFKDFSDLIQIIVQNPSGAIVPVLFALSIFITYIMKSLNYEKMSKFSFKYGYVLIIVVKFVIVGLIWIYLSTAEFTTRFDSLHNPLVSLNVLQIVLTLALLSPTFYIFIPITRIAELARINREAERFKKLYLLVSVITFGIAFLLILGFTSALSGFGWHFIWLGIGVLGPILLFFDISNYWSYLKDLVPPEEMSPKPASSKIMVLGIMAIIISVVQLLTLSILSSFVSIARGFLFAIPMCICIILLGFVAKIWLKRRWDVILACLQCTFFSSATWAFIMVAAALSDIYFLPSFITTYIFGICFGLLLGGRNIDKSFGGKINPT
jgi:hypothetical protein